MTPARSLRPERDLSMNENGKMYALSALKKRLARIAGQIFALKKQIGAKLGQLAHLDARLVLFDPETHPNSIRPKRVAAYQRVPLFSHGEIGRVILDVLREANGVPLAGNEIAARAIVKLNQPASAKMAMTSRVRSNLTYSRNKLSGRRSATSRAPGGRWPPEWGFPLPSFWDLPPVDGGAWPTIFPTSRQRNGRSGIAN
jgi:hypothetical protein